MKERCNNDNDKTYGMLIHILDSNAFQSKVVRVRKR